MSSFYVMSRCRRMFRSLGRYFRNREMQCGCILVCVAIIFISLSIVNTWHIDDEWTFPAPTLEQREWLKPGWFQRTNGRANSAGVEPLNRSHKLDADSAISDEAKLREEQLNEERIRKQAELNELLTNMANNTRTYHIGDGHLAVYNVSAPASGDFECMRMSIKPRPKICLYPNAVDKFISASIRANGVWEPHIMRTFQNILYGNPTIGVIDIGANIGMYSLVAGAMGHTVIAIEPYIGHLQRLHVAIKMNHIADKITVLQNVISNTRDIVTLRQPNDNQGGISVNKPGAPCKDCIAKVHAIHMDDILTVNVSFRQAVMKIDIEGHELLAFIHSDKLFEHVFIPYIFMEWLKLRSHFITDVHVSSEKDLVERLLEQLRSRGYTPYSPISFSKLDFRYWYGWPDDVWWKHELEEVL